MKTKGCPACGTPLELPTQYLDAVAEIREKVLDQGISKGRFLGIVAKVMKDMPLSLENEADGRHTWPRRWRELCKRVKTEANFEEE